MPYLRWGAVLAVLTVAPGCTRILGALEEELEEDVVEEVERRAGRGAPEEPEEDPPVEETVKINLIQPSRGVTTGGEAVEIIGFGFEEGMRVRFGTVDVETILSIDENSIQCLTPAIETPGWVVVRIFDAQGELQTLLENGFEYFDPVTVVAIDPERGPASGGTTIAVEGTGFVAGTTVQFGTLATTVATVIDGNSLTVTAPPLPRDTYAVTVTNNNGSYTLPGAYTTFEDVRVQSVLPFAGPIAGGTTIRVEGTGFVDPSTLWLGDQSLPATHDPTERSLTATTVPVAAEGAVDVFVENANGADTLKDGFVFYDASIPGERILSVSPSAALVEGGRSIRIVVLGMPDTNSTVTFGGIEAVCTVHDSISITCTAPSSPEGTVDVVVTNGAIVATAVDAFTYVDLGVDRLEPVDGAIAGGTRVVVAGRGFGPDTVVRFGTKEGTDLSVSSSEQLVVRTPRANVGTVSLTVETLGVSLTLDDAYSYFNPRDTAVWAWGGSVDGDINVTVVDDERRAIESAFVIVGDGVDETRPWLSGLTDDRGQLTLSGPDVDGPFTVHVGRTGFESFSYADFDARNLTFILSPHPEAPPDPLPECPQDAGAGGPPLIRGKVKRIKDQYNTGDDVVLITTTFASFSEPLPDPGPGAQLVSQGDYEIVSRTGDLVVLALAGRVMPDGTLDAHAMGFAPFVFAEPSSAQRCEENSECPSTEQCEFFDGEGYCLRVYEVDITVDTPLNQPMPVQLDNAPLEIDPAEFGAAPTTTSFDVWYDFGHMGIFPMQNYPLGPYPFGVYAQPPLRVTGAHEVTYDMPRRLPTDVASATFSVHTRVVGYGVQGDTAWSEVVTFELSDTSQPVVMSPFLPVTQELEPPLLDTGHVLAIDPTPLAFRSLPEPSVGPRPTGYYHLLYDFVDIPVCVGPFGVVSQSKTWFYWRVITPGTTSSFDLPLFPPVMGEANLPGNRALILWQTTSYLAGGVDFGNFQMRDLLRWDSRAIRLTAFFGR